MEYICQTNQTLNLRTVFFITVLVNHIQKKKEKWKKAMLNTHIQKNWIG